LALAISHGCGLVQLARSAWYRGDRAEERAKADELIIDAIGAYEHQVWQ
jgi:hypothetical protein